MSLAMQNPVMSAPPSVGYPGSPVDHAQIPGFLTKTYDIINDPSTDHIVGWSPSGETFVIHDTSEYCSAILPNHFKHNNLASFVRQLNIYGFQKVGNKHMWEFRHDRFRRGERHLISQIKRKTPTKRNWMGDSDNQNTEAILTELLQLKQRQELLEMNLVQVMNTNDSLWNDLVAAKQQQREIQDNLQKILYFLMTVYQNDEEKQSQLPQAMVPPQPGPAVPAPASTQPPVSVGVGVEAQAPPTLDPSLQQ